MNGSICLGIKLIIKLLHPIRRFLAHLLRHMAIDIQRELGGGVAQVGLDGFDVVSGIEGGDGEGVSQVVEPGFLHTGTLGHFLKMLDHSQQEKRCLFGLFYLRQAVVSGE